MWLVIIIVVVVIISLQYYGKNFLHLLLLPHLHEIIQILINAYPPNNTQTFSTRAIDMCMSIEMRLVILMMMMMMANKT